MTVQDSTLLSVDETARRRFESDRRRKRDLALDEYLPPPSDPRFLPTLEELIHLDLEWAWRQPGESGSGTRVEAYLERFTQLREPAILVRLVRQEYEVRHRFGDRPPADEYINRFPQLDLSTLAAKTVEYVGSADRPPEVPGYTILEPLGRGGMGVVYLARQDALNRTVAIKAIRGRTADEDHRARFKLEAETAAGLNHPNIVHVYEVGEAEGLPYLALEYVSGGTLDRALAGVPQTPKLAAATVECLARAVKAAHVAGVLHRDLKPANILLGVAEGGPLPWTPKVADFGLAKRLGEEGQTESGAVLGTPSYMAPEQAGGKREVGPSADIYGLGAILYEMITGRPPFRAATSFDTVVQVINEEPVPPSRLVPRVPRDLETICLKCLEKDPARRYDTADALAEDLARFQRDEPIAARRIGSAERAIRWARRRPTAAGLLVALLVAVVAASVGAVAVYFNGQLQTAYDTAESRRIDADVQRGIAEASAKEADKQRAEAEAQKAEANKQRAEAEAQKAEADKQRARAEQYQYYAHVRLAQQAYREGEVPRMLELLDRYPPEQRGPEWLFVRRLSRNLHVLRGHTHDVNCVAFHPDGRRVASASFDNTVRVWDAIAGKHLHTLRPPKAKRDDQVYEVAFHPDGERVAASFGSNVHLVRFETGQGTLFSKHTGTVMDIAFDRGGNRMVTCAADSTAIVWSVADVKPLFILKGEPGERLLSVRFDPSEERLIWTSMFETTTSLGKLRRGAVKAWDLKTKQELFRKSYLGFHAASASFHPKEPRVAVALWDGTIRVLAWPGGEEQLKIDAHAKGVISLAYSPDGTRLASTGFDLAVRLWDGEGREQMVLRGHTGRPTRDKLLGVSGVMRVAFNSAGTRLASGGDDRTVMIWDVGPSPDVPLPPERQKPPSGIFSPNREWLAVWKRPTFQLRDAASDKLIHAWKPDLDQPVRSWFSPRGDRVALECGKPNRNLVQVWDTANGRSLVTAPVEPNMEIDITTDGRYLFARTPAELRLWNLATGAKSVLKVNGPVNVSRIAVNSAGTHAVAIMDPKEVQKLPWDPRYAVLSVWDLSSGTIAATLRGHTWTVRNAAWTPDGGMLATCSQDETIILWNPYTGEPIRTLHGHTTTIYDVDFTFDGKRLVSCGEDKSIRMWDPLLGEEILNFGPSPNYVFDLEWGPRHATLFTRHGLKADRRVWDLRPLHE